jgi:hypothetical protein
VVQTQDILERPRENQESTKTMMGGGQAVETPLQDGRPAKWFLPVDGNGGNVVQDFLARDLGVGGESWNILKLCPRTNHRALLRHVQMGDGLPLARIGSGIRYKAAFGHASVLHPIKSIL